MRGLYAHASQRMGEDLTAVLQARWEQSLRDRAAIDPHSPVPLLHNVLAPFRTEPRGLDRGDAVHAVLAAHRVIGRGRRGTRPLVSAPVLAVHALGRSSSSTVP